MAYGDCHTFVAAHEILQAPSNVLTFDDEGGFREIKGKSYNVNGCQPHRSFLTGQQYIGNYTLMGHQSALDNGDCLVKRVGGESVYDSMQALVIRTNGWTIQPQAVDLDDLDAQSGVASEAGWKESMAIFGMLNGKLVKPRVDLYEGTLLASKEYTIPGAAMKEMELELGEVRVPGGEYVAEEMVNCPFGRENEESRRCRMTARFDGAVDTLVLLYAVIQKSRNDPNAAVFFSEMLLRCGCRCVQKDVGVRKITAGVPGVGGECVVVESGAPRTQCDLLGSMWCTKDDMVAYVVKGGVLGNGNFPCEEIKGDKVLVSGEFQPRKDFVPNVV